jgi:hypothetical protein
LSPLEADISKKRQTVRPKKQLQPPTQPSTLSEKGSEADIGPDFQHATGFNKVQELFGLVKMRAQLSPSPDATEDDIKFSVPAHLSSASWMLDYKKKTREDGVGTDEELEPSVKPQVCMCR